MAVLYIRSSRAVGMSKNLLGTLITQIFLKEQFCIYAWQILVGTSPVPLPLYVPVALRILDRHIWIKELNGTEGIFTHDIFVQKMKRSTNLEVFNNFYIWSNFFRRLLGLFHTHTCRRIGDLFTNWRPKINEFNFSRSFLEIETIEIMSS